MSRAVNVTGFAPDMRLASVISIMFIAFFLKTFVIKFICQGQTSGFLSLPSPAQGIFGTYISIAGIYESIISGYGFRVGKRRLIFKKSTRTYPIHSVWGSTASLHLK